MTKITDMLSKMSPDWWNKPILSYERQDWFDKEWVDQMRRVETYTTQQRHVNTYKGHAFQTIEQYRDWQGFYGNLTVNEAKFMDGVDQMPAWKLTREDIQMARKLSSLAIMKGFHDVLTVQYMMTIGGLADA